LQKETHTYRGELWAVLAALSYMLQTLTLRAAAPSVDPVVGALVMGSPTWVFAWTVLLTSDRRKGQVWPRSESFIGWRTVGLVALGATLSYAAGNSLWVWAMKLGGTTIVTPATQSLALWTALLGYLLLGERHSRRLPLGLAGFACGLLLLGWGRAGVSGLQEAWKAALFMALGAALCWSSASTANRFALLRGTDRFALLWLAQTVGMLSLAAMALVPNPSALLHIDRRSLFFLLAAGLLNLAAQSTLITALSLTSVASVGLISSTGGVLTPLAGALLFGDPLNGIMLGGMTLIVVSVAFIQWRGTGLSVQRKRRWAASYGR